MKTLARIEPNQNSQIIHISTACKLKREDPFNYENREYYDLIKFRPMVAVCRSGSSSFSFKPGFGPPGHGKGSKGIAHELVQEHICRLKNWSFKAYGKQYDIKIDYVEDEYHIPPVEGLTTSSHYVDCMIHLSKDCKYYDLFDGKIGIEVTDKHKTTLKKVKVFKKKKLFVFDIMTIPDWHIRNDQFVTSERLSNLHKRINGFLNNHVPGLWALNAPKRI